jgi:hypothetical protein
MEILFKRGTAEQHQNYIGRCGELTINQTDHTLHVHDGVTIGGWQLSNQISMALLINNHLANSEIAPIINAQDTELTIEGEYLYCVCLY